MVVPFILLLLLLLLFVYPKEWRRRRRRWTGYTKTTMMMKTTNSKNYGGHNIYVKIHDMSYHSLSLMLNSREVWYTWVVCVLLDAFIITNHHSISREKIVNISNYRLLKQTQSSHLRYDLSLSLRRLYFSLLNFPTFQYKNYDDTGTQRRSFMMVVVVWGGFFFFDMTRKDYPLAWC